MIAAVPVRDGQIPAGADETVAEAGGRVVLVGSGCRDAAVELNVATTEVRCAEVGAYAPSAWAVALAPLLRDENIVVLPASPDGRDLAPRLAVALDRQLYANAVTVCDDHVVVARLGGLVAEEHEIRASIVATLQPGARGIEAIAPEATRPEPVDIELTLADAPDAEVLEVVPPDPATMDLAEAPRIIAGGAGLGGADLFEKLERVATALGASYGASRVAADLGWVPVDRFIGTTGVAVNPRLYVAFAISGAVQHVGGLGDPERIISVNTDPSAPMMTMADVAIVSDARAVIEALAARLAES
jgi:electron transfer flavoprotein alpha subunit